MDGIYIGSVVAWGSRRIPVNWKVCDGSLLSISDYPALYSLIGTAFGGDGVKNFALPNFAGRSPYGAQMGSSGDSSVTPGKWGGQTGVAVTAANMPAHSHAITVTPATGTYMVSSSNGTSASPTNNKLGAQGSAANAYYNNTAQGDTTIAFTQVPLSAQIDAAPGLPGYTLTTQPPFLAVNYIICVEGLYPNPQ
ncbi:phage tail protein [Magnetospirillum sp. UT-4]|uniref:phage tail protein n=1 Tax=Magnetospirillum sp. UT-4 TaxID=2681467 RepID=UPI0013831992|nr:tail fiber protein [Magnetospirillum sp. UT-4]CAA7624960.1 putative Microcystin dependent protein [Magnetospirillum sp. UT-4]